MARNRLIKLEFWRDEKIGALSHSARLLFISLWSYADDSGNGRADARLLRSQAFPYDSHVTVDEVEKWLDEIAGLDMALLYTVGGARFYSVKNFLRHQVVNRPSKFRYPEPSRNEGTAPVLLTEGSRSVKGVVRDESKSKRERERKGVKKDSASALPQQADFKNLKNKDPRFGVIVEAYFEQFHKYFGEMDPDFDGSDAKVLSSLLKRRQETAETLKTWLTDAFASDDVPPLRPRFRLREFCSHAAKFSNGPLKKGTRPRGVNLENHDPDQFSEVIA